MKAYFIKFLSALSFVLFWQVAVFGQFVQMGSDILGSEASQQFGFSTAISQDGKIIAVGGALYNGIGRVQMYEWHNDNWVQKGNTIFGEELDDWSGRYVSINGSGNIIAIGAPKNDINGVDAGQLKVYEWDGTAWVQKGADIYGEAAGDQAAKAVSINNSGTIIAVGASLNDGNGSNSGHVRIYEWDGTAWVQKGIDIDGDTGGDASGSAVSLSANGNIVAIGAAGNAINGTNAGQVKIYEWNGTIWVQKGVDIYGEAANDESGNAINISADGNTVAIGAYLNDGNGSNSGHVRVYKWNGTAWIQQGLDIDGEGTRDRSGSAISLSANGNIVAIGAFFNDGNSINTGQVRIYEWSGTVWVQKEEDIDGEASSDHLGTSVGLSQDGKRVIIGSPLNDRGGSSAGMIQVLDFGKKITGQTFLDLIQNCVQDPLENNLFNRQLIINPGNITVQTTSRGYWGLDSLPVGTYTISTDTNPNNNYQPCAPTYTFTVIHPDSTVQTPPIGYQASQQCTSPSVSINAPFLRPGFSNQTVYVRACNGHDATTILDSAYVIVVLDTLLTVDIASLTYTSLGNNQYRVNVGDLFPNQCINFWLNCTLSQNAVLGSSLCMEAELYPIDSCSLDTIPNTTIGIPCTTAFDGSHLTIEATCINNDTISFTITNVKGAMSCWSQTRLYIDGVLVQTDSVQLLTGQSQTFNFAGDGRTWRMEVDQHPLHWGNSQPSTTIELCGNAANWMPDLVNVLPHDDADPVIDIYCGLVTGSYDPNDKTGFPLGVSTTHDILPNQKLEYRIRFQNTGTDTAFTVVIRDTLSTDFDIFSVISGASSHDYTFRLYGSRVLEWTFNNIMLPDSNVNEPLSNGFVMFEVQQQPNLPNGTVLENSAGIYFDFNAPIITNTSRHTINDGVIFLELTEVIAKEMKLQVYPNPTSNSLTIVKGDAKEVTLTLLNNLGQVLLRQPSTGQTTQLNLSALPTGIYYLHLHDGTQTAVQKIIKQ